jgi:hypothetical protein
MDVALGAGIKGIVTDEKNESVAFASVFVSGTTTGTTTNESGYFTLLLKPGNYNISVKSIGYTMQTKTVTVGNDEVEVNFMMKSEAIKIKEFTVDADAEDPAYAVIRQEINKRQNAPIERPNERCQKENIKKDKYHRKETEKIFT